MWPPCAYPEPDGQDGPDNRPASEGRQFAESERQFMLELARNALAAAVTPTAPGPEITAVSDRLSEQRACFITLTKRGVLRGCVGNLAPQSPLYQSVIDNAQRAALCDPRFPPVEAGELAELKIEITVLDRAQPLFYNSPEELLMLLQPHRDGVLLQIGSRSAMFLPQVWSQIPDKVKFLEHLAQKAGYPPAAWKSKSTEVSTYTVESFGEN